MDFDSYKILKKDGNANGGGVHELEHYTIINTQECVDECNSFDKSYLVCFLRQKQKNKDETKRLR
jgi:hypothetical protein